MKVVWYLKTLLFLLHYSNLYNSGKVTIEDEADSEVDEK